MALDHLAPAHERTMLLKVVGGGHNVELSVPDDATIRQVKEAVETSTGLAPEYQRLLYRGKAFDDDSVSAISAGLADRTKVMLMHSAAYARDQQAIEALKAVEREIDALEAKRGALSSVALEGLSTQLCCKLDAVEVGDSDGLRASRKRLLMRCDGLTSGNT